MTTTEVQIAAGGPMAGDILKCRLKPVKAADYSVAFTREELTRSIRTAGMRRTSSCP